MKFISKSSIWLSAASIIITIYVVLGNPHVRAQAFTLDFPLTSLGEGVLIMVLPMLLSSIAVIICLIRLKEKMARYGLISTFISWLIIWFVLGQSGFKHLF